MNEDAGAGVGCESLVTWLQTFNQTIPCPKLEDLSNGLLMTQALHSIDGAWFDESWLSHMNEDAGENWRIKISNLRKILQNIKNYYQEFLHQKIPECLVPDLSRIARQADPTQLARLIQLILGCAVNCANKKEHIHTIMKLEESVQLDVMRAIQELMGNQSADPLDDQKKRTINNSTEEEILRQRCEELESQVKSLQEERDSLVALSQTQKENQNHPDVVQKHIGIEEYFQFQIQIETLQEEKNRIELSKNNYQTHCEELEKKLIHLRLRNKELESIALEAIALKDEVDLLRVTTEKVTKLESKVDMCFKKLEELRQWLGQVKSMDEVNLKYVHDVMFS